MKAIKTLIICAALTSAYSIFAIIYFLIGDAGTKSIIATLCGGVNFMVLAISISIIRKKGERSGSN